MLMTNILCERAKSSQLREVSLKGLDCASTLNLTELSLDEGEFSEATAVD